MFDLLTNLFEIDRGACAWSFSTAAIHSGPKRSGARRKDLAELDKGRPERLESPAYTLGALEVRDVLRVLPPHEPAGTLTRSSRPICLNRSPNPTIVKTRMIFCSRPRSEILASMVIVYLSEL